MEISVENYFRIRHSMFKWRSETTLINKIILATLMACFTGLMAQIILPLPWTPVPITGQTMAVLLAGILLGRYWGGISMAMYIGIGLVGVPWFAGLTGGYGALIGATGGYLIGFILAALFLGYFAENYVKTRKFLPMLGLMIFANFVLIYIPGLLQLGIWIELVKGNFPGIWNLLLLGLIPFLAGDIIKIGAAAAVAKLVSPKKPYGSEKDASKWKI
jgi:biotin transport system substrate-specific component